MFVVNALIVHEDNGICAFFADGLYLLEHGLPFLVGVVDLKIEPDAES